MTKERGRVAPPEHKAWGEGKPSRKARRPSRRRRKARARRPGRVARGKARASQSNAATQEHSPATQARSLQAATKPAGATKNDSAALTPPSEASPEAHPPRHDSLLDDETVRQPSPPSIQDGGPWGRELRCATTIQSLDRRLVERWVRRGHMLLQKLAEHGAAEHEYRADLKEGRFVWLDAGRPRVGRGAGAGAVQLVASRPRSSRWRGPIRSCGRGHPRIDGMPRERDDVDEETAWRVAMEAAEARGAEYLYRVPTPHAWYFLALAISRSSPKRALVPRRHAGRLVLRELGETRQAIESRAEPAEVVRERLVRRRQRAPPPGRVRVPRAPTGSRASSGRAAA